jgi:hypothetical protein
MSPISYQDYILFSEQQAREKKTPTPNGDWGNLKENTNYILGAYPKICNNLWISSTVSVTYSLQPSVKTMTVCGSRQ